MHRKTIHDLGWGRLLEALALRCSTPTGEARARELELLKDRETIAARLDEVDEARRLFEAGESVPLHGFSDIRRYVDRVTRHAVLEASELIEVGQMLVASRKLTSFFNGQREEAPRLARRALPKASEDLRRLRDLEETLVSCFEDDGTISDRASPELASLRRQVRGLRERLSHTIEELIERYGDVLQDRYFTIRDDRYVLPVRTDAHRRVHGIVHGHSGSGQTIYVEPREITSAGNELMIARTAVAREEQRVLSELSEEVGRVAGEILDALEAATVVDLRVAGAKMSRELGASTPRLSDRGRLSLHDVRHPLMVLDGSSVIPNTIELDNGGVLVVSGPNGGGKTVALKTVGLACLMIRAGLPIAAEPDSEVPIVRSVLTDMGDDQSLEQSLSTFAAHMTNIARLLREAGEGDIVLLDELAGGTDPTEGAALATEIALALANRGAAVMCTTHYGSLKLLALQLEAFRGASLGFDRDRLTPTYRLSAGAPGVSGALAAALRYGLPEDVVEGARQRLGEDTQQIGALMEQLDAERERARSQADKVVEERAALEKARKALENERKDLARRHQEKVEREAQGLLVELRSAREQVRGLEERLRRRRRVKEEELKKATKTLDGLGRALAPGGKLAAALDQNAPEGREATEEELTVGVRVYVPNMRAEGEVVEPPKRKKVRVALGRVTVTVAVADVLLLDAKKAPAPKAPAPITIDAAGDPEVPAMTPDNTLDVRGERVDDAIREADKFIDRALERGWQVAFFIHGHGTGALRKGLREHFEESPYVERFKGGERRQGGDGVTVIWLA